MKAYLPRLLAAFIVFFFVVPLICADEKGYASWYGGKFQGRTTASGEIFDTNLLTAAHKTLPFGTIVRVTNLENNLSVEVKINDRGPFVEGRIIDLSHAAAKIIEMLGMGVAPVSVEVVSGSADIAAEDTAGEIPDKNNGLVIIQVGSFQNRKNAQAVLNLLKDIGVPAVFEESGEVIRVIIPEVAEKDTEWYLTKLKHLGFYDSFIRHFTSL
jgi:rare lipoprotein A